MSIGAVQRKKNVLPAAILATNTRGFLRALLQTPALKDGLRALNCMIAVLVWNVSNKMSGGASARLRKRDAASALVYVNGTKSYAINK